LLALVFLVGAVPATTTAAVGPGSVSTVVSHGTDRVVLSISPNSGGLIANTFAVRWTRRGDPVPGTIRAVFTMQGMPMPSLRLTFRPVSDGVYRGTGRVLTMPGRWEIRMHFRPRRGESFDVVVVDRVTTGILEHVVARART
jgi:YtkA-like